MRTVEWIGAIVIFVVGLALLLREQWDWLLRRHKTATKCASDEDTD